MRLFFGDKIRQVVTLVIKTLVHRTKIHIAIRCPVKLCEKTLAKDIH